MLLLHAPIKHIAYQGVEHFIITPGQRVLYTMIPHYSCYCASQSSTWFLRFVSQEGFRFAVTNEMTKHLDKYPHHNIPLIAFKEHTITTKPVVDDMEHLTSMSWSQRTPREFPWNILPQLSRLQQILWGLHLAWTKTQRWLPLRPFGLFLKKMIVHHSGVVRHNNLMIPTGPSLCEGHLEPKSWPRVGHFELFRYMFGCASAHGDTS